MHGSAVRIVYARTYEPYSPYLAQQIQSEWPKVLGRRQLVCSCFVSGIGGGHGVGSRWSFVAGGRRIASIATGGIATQNTAPVILAEEEISGVSLAAFFVFDKEMAGARSVRVAAGHGGCGHGGARFQPSRTTIST